MRRSLAALAALSLLACNRSDLLDRPQCPEGGRYVAVDNNAFCVYPDADVFPCPDELPYVVRFAGAGFCAIEEAPAEPLLGEALRVALEVDAGVAPDSDAGDLDGSVEDGGGTGGSGGSVGLRDGGPIDLQQLEE